MVDEIITRQELINAKRDARDLGEAVNEVKIVSPRYGEDFKSLPMIVGEFQDAINTIVIEDGVPALTVSDASGKTQQEINDAQQVKNKETKSIWEFMTLPELIAENADSTSFNWSPVAQRAMDSDYPVIYIPAKKLAYAKPEPYYCDWTIFVRKEKVIVGDGANVSKFKLFDQSSIYHNPNRSTDKNDKGLGEFLYEDYHAVMVAFTNNFTLDGVGLNANALNNYVTVGGNKYHYASTSNGAGMDRWCNILVLESPDGGTKDNKWRVWASKLESSSRAGLLLNQTASLDYEGRFEFESSHVKNTHEDSLSFHKIKNFEVWNSSFGNSHSHANHFYHRCSGGRVHDNNYYLDDSYENILPQTTTEKFAFVFGHNEYDFNVCENVQVYNNTVENKWTRGSEIANMKLCFASVARTPKNIQITGNTGRNLWYAIDFSGVPVGENLIMNNNFEYDYRGLVFDLSRPISSSVDTSTQLTSKFIYGGNTFKCIGAGSGLSIRHDIGIIGNVPASENPKIDRIMLLDLGNNYDRGVYTQIASPKIRAITKETSRNLLARCANNVLVNNKLSAWVGRSGNNSTTNYSVPDPIVVNDLERITGFSVNSTHTGGEPVITSTSEFFGTRKEAANISFYATNLNPLSAILLRVEQVLPNGTIRKVLLHTFDINAATTNKLYSYNVSLDAAELCFIRVQFFGTNKQALNFELRGLQMVLGYSRKLCDYFYQLESSVIPTDTDKPIGTQVLAINPTTNLGWVYTTTGWKTYGAIT